MRIPRRRLALTAGALLALLILAAGLVLGRPASRSAIPADAARGATEATLGSDPAGSVDAGWLEALAAVAKPTERGADAGLAHLGRFFRHARHLVHAEATLDLPDKGLMTFALDHGVLTAADENSLTLRASDGSMVTVATNAETKVRKERQKASLDDLAAGVEVYVLSVKVDAGFTARHVWAPKVRETPEG
jgi:hypothetical protein